MPTQARELAGRTYPALSAAVAFWVAVPLVELPEEVALLVTPWAVPVVLAPALPVPDAPTTVPEPPVPGTVL
jgi:hypothetical protein